MLLICEFYRLLVDWWVSELGSVGMVVASCVVFMGNARLVGRASRVCIGHILLPVLSLALVWSSLFLSVSLGLLGGSC